MKFLIMLLFPVLCFAAEIPPTPFPVFMKMGFTTVLEFSEAPSRVVLGDSQSFQIERLNRSIVLKALAPYASTNMFVYFATKDTRLFVITTSEDAEPTYFRKFEDAIIPKPTSPKQEEIKLGVKVTSAHFDQKRDYFTVEISISSDSNALIKPNWDLIRLSYKNGFIAPKQLWSERKEVQRNASTKARFIFVKPNIPSNLAGVRLIVPVAGRQSPFSVLMSGGNK